MTSHKLRGLLAASAIALSGIAVPAAAQSSDRIGRLEAEVRDLQSVVYSVERAGAPVRQGAAQSAGPASPQDVVRIAQLEEEIARLTGRIEELNFRLAGQQRQLDTIMAVLGDTRGGSGNGTPGSAGVPGGDIVIPADEMMTRDDAQGADADAPFDLSGAAPAREEVAVDLPSDEDDAYDVAYEALLAGDYARSEAAFEAYVETFPEGVRTAEAKYLLGEIYLATGAYAQAATTFLDHVKSYPDDVRAPEAYLKLGTAFARLEKADEACKVFRVGRSKFPQMSASVKARFEAESRQADCSG